MPVSLNEGDKSVSLDMVIEDSELFSFLSEMKEEQREPLVRRSLDIGYRAISRAQTLGVTDLVERSFGQLLNNAEKSFTGLLKDTELKLTRNYEDLKQKLERRVEEILDGVSKLFNPDVRTSYVARFSAEVEEYFRKGGTVEALFDPSNEGGPIYRLRQDVLKGIQEVRDLFVKKEERAAVEVVTPLKGIAFEDACQGVLERIAKGYYDHVERVTDKEGAIKGSKKGDFVVTLYERPDLKIVFESKNVSYQSEPEILKILEEAMQNRGASYGILVSATVDAFPKKIGYFSPYPENRWACVFSGEPFSAESSARGEILEIAYKFGRLDLMRQKAEVAGIDIKMVKEALEGIKTALSEYTTMLKYCTTIEMSYKNAMSAVTDLRAKLNDTRDRINRYITSGMQMLEKELAK